MKYRNSVEGYGLIAIALHWSMALVVFGLFGVGLWMVNLTYYSSWYQTAPALHKAVGLVMMLALLLRLLWRGINPTPKPHAQHHRLEQLGARIGHLLLYGGLMLVLVSGYLISTADGRSIDLFGVMAVPALLSAGEPQAELAGLIHFYGAWALVLAAVGHGLAALKHHFVDKDSTLLRMLKPTQD